MSRLVALLTNSILPYRAELLLELQRKCGDLEVFISHTRPTQFDGVKLTGLKSLQWREVWRHSHGFTERLDINFPYDTLPHLGRFKPDVVISGELGLRTLQAAVYRRFVERSRLVIWATVSEFTEQARGMIRPVLRRGLLRLADAVIVNGASGARYVGKFGVPRNRIFNVPQTTALDEFLALSPSRSGPALRRLLYVGRLIELKGLVPFLGHLSRAAAARPTEQIEFWIAGDGPVRDNIAQFALPRNLSVRLLGNIPYHRLAEFYSKAAIFVFPTLADEWGMVVVEAMAAGLPILGSAYSQAVEELVTPGLNGWIFRPDQSEEVSGALSEALALPPAERDRMGHAAQRRVATMTPKAMAEQMISALDYAVGHHN